MVRFRFLSAVPVILACAAVATGQPAVGLPSPSATIGEPGEFLLGKLPITEGSSVAEAEPIVEMGDGTYSEALLPDVEESWIQPKTWFSPTLWEHGIELGINGSEGNAQTFSLLSGGHFKRTSERSALLLDVIYAKTESASLLTQHYAFMNARWDFKLGDSRWSIFNISRLEYDEFKSFDLRLSLSGGVGYDIIRSDTAKLTGRFGSGASREFGGGDEEWIPEAVFGADYEHKLSQRQKLTLTADYYPAWEEFADYRMVTKASWELLLDEETNLSLKVGVLDRYDSTPFGRMANDLDYFVTLLWKL